MIWHIFKPEPHIIRYEGRKETVFSDDGNPCETITITAAVKDGLLEYRITDSDHSPDGGTYVSFIRFDAKNSEKPVRAIERAGGDFFEASRAMMNRGKAWSAVKRLLEKKGIRFTESWS